MFNHHNHIIQAIDGAAIGVVVASLAGWLPPLAALLSVVWLGMQITTWIANKNWRRKP